MNLSKFCIVSVNREEGPKIIAKVGFTEDDETNILLFGLPSGEAIHGSYKFTRIQDLYYCSYVEIDSNNNLNASVIGIKINELNFNPFQLCPLLEEMVSNQRLPDPTEITSSDYQLEYKTVEGLSYLIASLFILQRVIVIGEHADILTFFATIYQGLPTKSLTELSCLTYTNALHNQHNLQGIPPDESLAEDLARVQTTSTIVILDKGKIFGMYESPFCKEIEQYYLNQEFSKSRERISQFVEMALSEEIRSTSDFAKKYRIPRSDAKLMKKFQERYANTRNSMLDEFGLRRLN